MKTTNTPYKNYEQYYLANGGHYDNFKKWEKGLSDYERQGIDFLIKTGTTFNARMIGHGPYFDDDDQSRDIYMVTLQRGNKKYSFRFGQSIVNSGTMTENHVLSQKAKWGERPYSSKDFAQKRKAPTPYVVLSGIQKYDMGSFENFCAELGYELDSRKAEKTYFAVQKEYAEVKKLFNEKEIEELAEIC